MFRLLIWKSRLSVRQRNALKAYPDFQIFDLRSIVDMSMIWCVLNAAQVRHISTIAFCRYQTVVRLEGRTLPVPDTCRPTLSAVSEQVSIN
jgi:hypothetical protein